MTDQTRLDSIMLPQYVEALGSRSMGELRDMKQECDEEEAALSYARRLLQGKIDLISAELHARTGERAGAGAADIAHALSGSGPGGFRGRFPRIMVPPETRETREVLALLADPVLMNLETVTNDELRSAAERLVEVEGQISELRSGIHSQTGHVESEIARRYASGEVTVDEVLGA